MKAKKKKKQQTKKYLFSDLLSDPKDLLSSRGPLLVDTVSTFPSISKVVSMFSLEPDAWVGLSARGDRLKWKLTNKKITKNSEKILLKQRKKAIVKCRVVFFTTNIIEYVTFRKYESDCLYFLTDVVCDLPELDPRI